MRSAFCQRPEMVRSGYLAPLAAVLGLLAWWLVVARLRSSGPEEFFAALAADKSVTEH